MRGASIGMEVIITYDDFRKYPFIPEAIDYVRKIGITFQDLSYDKLGLEIIEHSRRVLEASIDNKELPYPHPDPDIEVLVFLVTMAMLKLIGDPSLTERYATAFSKRLRKFTEDEELSKLIHIAVNVLGWKMRLDEGDLYLHFADYLEHIPEFRGGWKLVNKQMIKGWVRLSTREFARLLESGIKKFIVDRARSDDILVADVPDVVFTVIEKVSSKWARKLAEYDAKRARLLGRGEELYPPCMKNLLSELRSGKNLTHGARFTLASFLLHTGMKVEEVLDVFRVTPDFREDLARYQIEHIAGLRGSRTKYLPYKCDNMRSLGLCRWNCINIKHPIQFYFRSARGRSPRVEPL